MVTLNVSVGNSALLIIGVFAAAIESARVPVVRQIIRVYIELSRNTPLLVQLYFIYFDYQNSVCAGRQRSQQLWVSLFLGGSYMAEALRGGLDAVAPIQRESARMLGMNMCRFSRALFCLRRSALQCQAL